MRPSGIWRGTGVQQLASGLDGVARQVQILRQNVPGAEGQNPHWNLRPRDSLNHIEDRARPPPQTRIVSKPVLNSAPRLVNAQDCAESVVSTTSTERPSEPSSKAVMRAIASWVYLTAAQRPD